jgi:hypothetical protein
MQNPASINSTDLSIPFILCPVTKLEMNGRHPFVVVWSSGFVLSERALKEVGVESLQEEYGPFQLSDTIKLLPLEAEMDELREAMFYRRQQKDKEKEAKKSQKKEKKSSSQEKDNTNNNGNNDDNDEDINNKNEKKNRKRKSEEISSSSQVHPSETPILPSGIAPATVAALPKPTTTSSSSNKLITSAKESIKAHEQKSDVYKSLFHKESTELKDRDLFMSVAGIRYTLG